MGQEPTIEIRPEERPRAEPEPAPARRWSASRPGDLHAPTDVPWGGGFGTPGPDTGYAHKLAAGAEYSLGEDESRHGVDAMLAMIMAARASRFGKAPSSDDLGFALLVTGLGERDALPDEVVAGLDEHRRHWGARVAHSKAEGLRMVGLLPREILELSVEGLRHRLALGEVPLAP